MGGRATFTGTEFQACAIAYVYVHVLAHARLGWIPEFDDTPIGIAGESGGAGDDIRLEFGGVDPVAEAQAKHGLTGGARLREALQQIAGRSQAGDDYRIVILVNRGSSGSVHREFAEDLLRLQSGRDDGLHRVTSDLRTELGTDAAILLRIRVIAIDVLRPADPEAKFALDKLGAILEDPSQATAAWSVLVADAGQLCAGRLRRTRRDLVNLLEAAEIKVAPLGPNARWHQELDFTKRLAANRRATAVLTMLTDLERKLADESPDPLVMYRLWQQRGSALLQLHREGEALTAAERALDYINDGVHALRTATLAAIATGDLERASRFADRSVANHADDPIAWSAMAEVSAARGHSEPRPPAAVAESAEYRETLAQIAANRGDWETVLRITEGLVGDGVRSEATLFFRVQALLAVQE